jgi:hypothetical protein
LQTCGVLGNLAAKGYSSLAQRGWNEMFSIETVSPYLNPKKANRVHYAQEMIWALDNYSRTGFKYLLIGAESWMIYDLCYDTVDVFKRP